MKDFPKTLKTKQDLLNCIADFGRSRTVEAFGALLIDDATVEVVSSYDLDEKTGEMMNITTKTVKNPNPAWRRMGFESLADMLTFREV